MDEAGWMLRWGMGFIESPLDGIGAWNDGCGV